MKRCNNCGWGQNPDSSTHCEKCNSPLTDMGGGDHTTRDSGGYQESPEVNLNQTVREPGAGRGMSGQSSHRATQRKFGMEDGTIAEPGSCPKCGYPLRSGSNKCPRCQTFVDDYGTVEDYDRGDDHRHRNRRDDPYRDDSHRDDPYPPRTDWQHGPSRKPSPNSDNAFKKTVAPGQFKRNQIRFSALNPYEDPSFEPLELQFCEDENLLNRASVEADNPTISRNQHALLTVEDGKWYLENKSSALATSLVLTGKHEIQDGDIVIIGNRIFKISI
jgi:hypothetical protein